MSGGGYMPIGRFARSCRLSVKALRHYDELGLLVPAFVDPQSGYRYYTREQARVAVMIGMLRSLDLPLDVIRRALTAGAGELKVLIDAEAARIEAEVAQRERTLLSLRHLASSGSLAPTAVEVRDLAARAAARLSGTTDEERLVPDTTELVDRLVADVVASSLTLCEPVFTINEFGEGDAPITVHACVQVEGATDDLREGERVELAGGPCATLRHVGPYETLGLAHHALFAWAQERGHEPLGPVWEFYVNHPGVVAPEALVTDVALPLADA